MRVPAWLESPFVTLCVPPALVIATLLGLCVPALLAAGWGLRQAALGRNKIVSALGMAFNLAYALGFVVFYVTVFVPQSWN